MNEETNKIMERILVKHQSLKINRIPEKTKSDFIKLANEEFCSDYGMLLKFLMDGLVSADAKMLMEMINQDRQEIEQLKQEVANLKGGAIAKPKEKVITMLNGRVIRRKRR